jgi:hypothetical protein
MGLRGAIASLATGTYTVQRREAGSYTLGRYTPGALSTFSIVASVQPVSGRELKDLPEGQHGDELRLVLTTTELRTRFPGQPDASEYGVPGNDPDHIILDGEPWRIVHVERWQSFGEVHYECFVAREVGGETGGA